MTSATMSASSPQCSANATTATTCWWRPKAGCAGREGQCRYVGLSNVSVDQIDAASRIVEVASVQNRLNPYFRESLGVAEECGRRGIAFLAYSPVGGGRLAKKLPQFDVLQR